MCGYWDGAGAGCSGAAGSDFELRHGFVCAVAGSRGAIDRRQRKEGIGSGRAAEVGRFFAGDCGSCAGDDVSDH